MKNIIEEFYYGNIEPQEVNTHLTLKLRNKLKEVVQAEEKLKPLLSEEANKHFTEYSELYNEFMCISCCDGFISGFKLGARIAHAMFL